MPDELLILSPAVVKVEQEAGGQVTGEEVVLRMEEEKGIRASKFFLNSKEIVLTEALPTEVRI